MVLAVTVRFPWTNRPWALPVLCVLYTPPEVMRRLGRKHRTTGELARILTRRMLGWFPERRFVLTGDGQYSTHEMTRFAHAYRTQLTFVGRFYGNANLYDPRPEYFGTGRPRVKGERQPKPEELAQTKRGRKTQVAWYGGGERQVKLVRGQGHWYKPSFGLVPVSFVYVEDMEGTHRPEYFYSSDPSWSGSAIVGSYVSRWAIEVTFWECKARLGLGSPRRFNRLAVERVEPWLMSLYSLVSLIYSLVSLIYSLVSLIYHQHQTTHSVTIPSWPWYEKTQPIFSTALSEVRRLIWNEWVFEQPQYVGAVKKLPHDFRDYLLKRLTMAA